MKMKNLSKVFNTSTAAKPNPLTNLNPSMNKFSTLRVHETTQWLLFSYQLQNRNNSFHLRLASNACQLFPLSTAVNLLPTPQSMAKV